MAEVAAHSPQSVSTVENPKNGRRTPNLGSLSTEAVRRQSFTYQPHPRIPSTEEPTTGAASQLTCAPSTEAAPDRRILRGRRGASTSAGVASTDSNKSRWIRRALASITLTLGALVAVAAPASASYGNTTLDAACEHTAVQAFAPNLQGQTGWAVTWQPTLYWFDGTNWQPYLSGPVQTQTSDSWILSDFIFSNLPNGYFQVRDSFQWLYN